MTLRLYAGRKGIPLESVTIRLTHRRVHARDCQDCEATEAAYIDFIEREILVAGPITEEQRERLLWIAGGCPATRPPPGGRLRRPRGGGSGDRRVAFGDRLEAGGAGSILQKL